VISPAIETHALTKRYGRARGIEDVAARAAGDVRLPRTQTRLPRRWRSVRSACGGSTAGTFDRRERPT
jgi:hypothetical protein